MAALKAVIIALSLLGVAILYSYIVEDEELNMESSGKFTSFFFFFLIVLVLNNKFYSLEIDQSQASDPSTGTGYGNVLMGQLLTGESGSFASPNFPAADHKLDYLWLIKVAKTNKIRLVIVDFDTETNFDYLFVSRQQFIFKGFHLNFS